MRRLILNILVLVLLLTALSVAAGRVVLAVEFTDSEIAFVSEPNEPEPECWINDQVSYLSVDPNDDPE